MSPAKKNPATNPLCSQRVREMSEFTAFVISTMTTELESMSDTPPKAVVSIP